MVGVTVVMVVAVLVRTPFSMHTNEVAHIINEAVCIINKLVCIHNESRNANHFIKV